MRISDWSSDVCSSDLGPEPDGDLNIYARIIIDEARRRGISVEVEDAAAGIFTLANGARMVRCRESLSDLTTAVAMSRCDDKALTQIGRASCRERVWQYV